MLRKLALLTLALLLSETALFAIGVGDSMEFQVDYWARSNNRNFIHEFHGNVKFAVPPGTRATVREAVLLRSGNYAIRAEVTSGRRAGEEAWFYYTSPVNLHGAAPLIALLTSGGQPTEDARRAAELRTQRRYQALQTVAQRDGQPGLRNVITEFHHVGAALTAPSVQCGGQPPIGIPPLGRRPVVARQAAGSADQIEVRTTTPEVRQQARPQAIQSQVQPRGHAYPPGPSPEIRARIVAKIQGMAAPGNSYSYSKASRLGPGSFDCSGFVQTIYGSFGMHYQGNTTSVSRDRTHFQEIPASEARPGDITMHLLSDGNRRENHMGILVDTDGTEISATTAQRPPSHTPGVVYPRNAIIQLNVHTKYPAHAKTRYYRWRG